MNATSAAAPTGATAPDPLLVTLANMNPELDAIRWRVRLADDTRAYIAGEKVETDDSRVLCFRLDDGTLREFAAGEWTSATGMPGKPEPVLSEIIFRLYMFGEADTHDILNPGSWLIAQPEWIAREREHYKDDPVGLASVENLHFLRSRGL